MKILMIFMISINIAFCGVYRADVDVNELIELANQDKFDCVGQVKWKVTQTGGSCIAISDHIVLTNAHVLQETKTEPDTLEMNGQMVIVYEPISERWGNPEELQLNMAGKIYDIDRIVIHPDYLDSNINETDFAIIIIKEKITGVNFPLINETQLTLGTEIIGVGFGASGAGNDPASVTIKGEKIYGTNIIDSISISITGHNVYYTDFDSDNGCCNEMGDNAQTTYEYCSTGGDSGCPYFVEREGKIYFMGLLFGASYNIDNIQKGTYYGTTNSILDIRKLIDWVEENK